MTLELKGTLPERLRLLATFQKGGSDTYRETMLEAASAFDERDALLRELRDYSHQLASSLRSFGRRAAWPERGDLQERLTAVVGQPDYLGNPPSGAAE